MALSSPRRSSRTALSACLLVLLIAGNLAAADWPMYRHDAARSGITTEKLPTTLVEGWSFKPLGAPQPAWGDPKPEAVEGYRELRRIHFDDCFQPVASGDAVYFGSSARQQDLLPRRGYRPDTMDDRHRGTGPLGPDRFRRPTLRRLRRRLGILP